MWFDEQSTFLSLIRLPLGYGESGHPHYGIPPDFFDPSLFGGFCVAHCIDCNGAFPFSMDGNVLL